MTRTYGLADLDGDADGGGSCCGPETETAGEALAAEGALASAFIRATKPA